MTSFYQEDQKMSAQDEESKFTPQHLILIGIGFVMISAYYFSIQDLEDALSFFIMGVLLVLLGWWRIRVNRPEQWLINFIGMMVIIVISVHVSGSVSDKKNQSALKNTICGKVDNIYQPQNSRGSVVHTFDVANGSSRVTLPYHDAKHKINQYEKKFVCNIHIIKNGLIILIYMKFLHGKTITGIKDE